MYIYYQSDIHVTKDYRYRVSTIIGGFFAGELLTRPENHLKLNVNLHPNTSWMSYIIWFVSIGQNSGI